MPCDASKSMKFSHINKDLVKTLHDEAMECVCQICGRSVPNEFIEKHHLIPRSKHGAKGDKLVVCCNCGDMLHQLFDNKQLSKELNTLYKILHNERVAKWVLWVRNKPEDFRICMKKKK